jgi:SpoVK/Ycf46/Vps4 family AAA+-type ATPase
VVDEVEKVMPSSRGHQGDSGVSGRMEGAFLTALNDIQERVFFVFTANDVRNVHEAFFRAERVDAVFVVLLPTAASRAVSWLLYAKMFFPKDREIDGKVIANPHYIPREFQPLLTELRKATKGAEATEVAVRAWADKFTVPLMCLAPDDRTKATEQLKVVSPRVAEAVQLVNDDGWSPAEIRACCRLSMKLDEPLTTTQKRIRPVSVSAKKVIRALVEWASESALDAETGEVFAGASAQVGADGTVRERERETGGVRRKVRKVRED